MMRVRNIKILPQEMITVLNILSSPPYSIQAYASEQWLPSVVEHYSLHECFCKVLTLVVYFYLKTIYEHLCIYLAWKLLKTLSEGCVGWLKVLFVIVCKDSIVIRIVEHLDFSRKKLCDGIAAEIPSLTHNIFQNSSKISNGTQVASVRHCRYGDGTDTPFTMHSRLSQPPSPCLSLNSEFRHCNLSDEGFSDGCFPLQCPSLN